MSMLLYSYIKLMKIPPPKWTGLGGRTSLCPKGQRSGGEPDTGWSGNPGVGPEKQVTCINNNKI